MFSVEEHEQETTVVNIWTTSSKPGVYSVTA